MRRRQFLGLMAAAPVVPSIVSFPLPAETVSGGWENITLPSSNGHPLMIVVTRDVQNVRYIIEGCRDAGMATRIQYDSTER